MKRILLWCAALAALGCAHHGVPHERSLQRAEALQALKTGAQGRFQGVVRAASLRNLQKALRACLPGGCSERLLALGGMTHVHGYSIDVARGDIVLLGSVSSGHPGLRLEDFIVALRNAWLRYAPRQGNTILVSAPGCSIDPDPNVIQRLRAMKDYTLPANTAPWDAVCRSPQQVRIFGVPIDVRFSQVMVKADYDMKRLTNGMDVLPGLESLSDRRFKEYKDALIRGKNASVSEGGNRFWFAPGSVVFNGTPDGALLEKLEVRLLTETDRRGMDSGEKVVDPLARRFAEEFTSMFDAAATQYPIYAELENLFRFVALAKVLKMRAADEKSGLDLSVLLDEFPVPPVFVERTLPGIPSNRSFQHQTRRAVEGGTLVKTTQACIPTCGGVSMDIKTEHLSNSSTRLSGAVATASSRRPTADAVFWEL